ncbi:TraB/GumN family protein [Zooshikella sp. RANM57]|uniref:TraB/GumN family protein n=1 Tax=Zooshikella sp. RANM57 TaxID=3425863 RepID=UPI003D6E47C4
MKFSHTLKVGLSALLLVGSGFLWSAEDKGLFWHVTSSVGSAHVLGTIHFADKSFYPLRKEIMAAFEKSDVLVGELDAEALDSKKIAKILAKETRLPKGETIEDHLDAAVYSKLKQYLQQENVPLTSVEHTRPGWLMMQIMSRYIQKLGYKAKDGIDRHFIQRAQGKKEIVGLETFVEQLRLFLELDDANALVSETLRSIETMDSALAALVDSWKKGDDKQLELLLIKEPLLSEPKAKPYFERFIWQRNRTMAKKISTLLKEPKHYFIVIGSGHLIGDQSVLSELASMGMQVERL